MTKYAIVKTHGMRTPLTYVAVPADTKGAMTWDEVTELCSKLNTLLALADNLPDTYYADRPLPWRLQQMVRDWRRAIKVNKELEQKLELYENSDWCAECNAFCMGAETAADRLVVPE